MSISQHICPHMFREKGLVMRRHVNSRARRTKRINPRLMFLTGALAVGIMGILALAAFAPTSASQTVTRPSVSPVPGTHGIRLTKSNNGPITQNDVIKYVQTVGMPRMHNPTGSFTVTRAALLTSSAISARLHGEETGYPDSALLWFVEVHGTFVFFGPQGRTVTAHIGYQVFDPTTGDLVMFGGMG